MAQTDLRAVCAPIDQALGLPIAHYVDPAVFDEENRALIFESWAGLAAGADVPEPGDAKPITFLGIPLLLLRDISGQVRVFQNTCRHRGMILGDTPRKIEGVIRCPYHSWCYATSGRLVTTPHVGGPGQNTAPGIEREDLGLIEIRTHIWMDVVWVNFSGTAPDFEIANADLISRCAEFDKPLFHGGAGSRFTLDVQCNWKLAVEHYCESYHLPWVHPGLNSYSRLEDHYHIEAKGLYSGQGTLVYRQLRGDNGKVFPDFADLGGHWNQGAEYVALYPNVLLGVHRDHVFTIILTPTAHNRTEEIINLYYAAPDTDAALRKRNAVQWKEVFVEDIAVVEGMQRGRHSPKFDGGRFSPAMVVPTHMFREWVATRLIERRAAQQAAE